MEDIYKNITPDKIPWNIKSPPTVLVDLVEKKKILPCRTLEIGCGVGNYAIYLAKSGFDVTGIDISPTAISMARENATKMKVACNFLLADFLNDSDKINQTFDFIFDWSVLHHIFPEDRERFAGNVNRLLKPGGTYLSVCFSEKDAAFGGQGKFRETPIGTTLYFSSEQEIHKLFSPYFNVQELKTIEIEGKPTSHLSIYAFMGKEL